MSVINQALNQTNNEFNQALSKQKGSNLDKESFMLLLVTQFKYQDPLNPMEDKEFIAQMAQFSSLEQMMNLNTSMDNMVEATNNQQMINATSYIGKLVTVTGNTIGKVTDGATKQTTISTFRYAFGDNVVKGTLSVKDANGNTIYTEDLSGKQAGTTFEFNWNGKTGAGETAPDGVYVVTLSAFNSDGEAVLSDQVVDANVTGLVNQDGVIYLGMEGGQLMALSNVRQVTTPKVTAPADSDEENRNEEETGGESGGSPGGSGSTEGSGSSNGSGSTEGTNPDGGETPPDNPGQEAA